MNRLRTLFALLIAITLFCAVQACAELWTPEASPTPDDTGIGALVITAIVTAAASSLDGLLVTAVAWIALRTLRRSMRSNGPGARTPNLAVRTGVGAMAGSMTAAVAWFTLGGWASSGLLGGALAGAALGAALGNPAAAAPDAAARSDRGETRARPGPPEAPSA